MKLTPRIRCNNRPPNRFSRLTQQLGVKKEAVKKLAEFVVEKPTEIAGAGFEPATSGL
jgi:hypothetical protein